MVTPMNRRTVRGEPPNRRTPPSSFRPPQCGVQYEKTKWQAFVACHLHYCGTGLGFLTFPVVRGARDTLVSDDYHRDKNGDGRSAVDRGRLEIHGCQTSSTSLRSAPGRC
jgi:hypothetical protein